MKMSMRITSLIAGVLLAGAAQAALVGEWKFEDGLAIDSSGNGNDGVIVGSIASVSGVEAGTSAMEFNAESGYVSIPPAAFSSVGEEISISMWTFGDAVLGDGAACSGFGSNNRDMLHSHTPWANGAIYWDAGGARHNYAPSPATKYKGKWNHLVFTMNTTTGDKRVYINGEQDSPDWNASLTSLTGAITAFAIGSNNGSNRYYGKLDEFQLYDHELSATEISNLYASVTVDAYASANISASGTSGAIPLEIVFDGTNSTASGEITSYDWDFGDGNGASGPLVTNTYTVSGVYTASLEIATSEGLSSTSTVEIIAQTYVGAELVVTVESSSESNQPAFYTDDLGQTALLSTEGEGEGSGTIGLLFNGALGDQAKWNATSIKTINFDVSNNTEGYDISEISTIAGWNPASGGRANQQFAMAVTYVDDTTAILADAQNWAPNNDPSYYWTKVTFVETNGLPMARGVKAITWYDFSNANPGSVVIGQEFDILGTPTTDDYIYAGIAASPDAGSPALEVVFDGSASASSSNITSYEWDFGDGNTASGVIVTNIYTDAGDYVAELTVSDDQGQTGVSTYDITVYHFSTAVATATPTSGVFPLEVVLDGSGSLSSSTIISYDWDFGDGNTDSGMMVSNLYASGNFTATLVVTDVNGMMDTNTVALSVSKALDVNYVQYSEMIPSNTVPVISSDDLAQTAYLSSEGTGGNESGQHAQLFNGVIGNQDGDTNDDGEVRLSSGETITVTFDTSVNALGYDIDMIETFAGWTPTTYTETATNNLSRSNQGYEIIVGFADGTFGTMAGPEHWEPNGEASWTNSVGYEVNDTYWTKVGFTNATGGAMLTNVKSITFDISNNAQAGGIVIYREFDVFGVPSTGYYPNSIEIGSMDGGDSLSWLTDGVYNYSVQRTMDLVNGSWDTFMDVVGTPPVTTVVLPPKTEGHMFIRVIVE